MLTRPLTVIVIDPEVAPAGTGTVMLWSVHAVGAAGVPLKDRTLEPWVGPKPAPVMVTEVPGADSVGVTAPKPGPGVTVNESGLLDGDKAGVTRTGPEVAPLGTTVVIEIPSSHNQSVLAPLKLTVPPCHPKPMPAIVTSEPAGPLAGEMLRI